MVEAGVQQSRHKQGFAQQLTRRWRAWRARARGRQALLALSLAFGLGLGGPLLCVFHCDIWMPLMSHSPAAHAHHHHMMNGQAMDDAAMAAMPGMAHAASAAQPAPRPAQPSAGCAVLTPGGAPDGVPMPPSPVYELLTVALAGAVLLVLLSRRGYPAPPGDPPALAYSPVLRPPIGCAA